MSFLFFITLFSTAAAAYWSMQNGNAQQTRTSPFTSFSMKSTDALTEVWSASLNSDPMREAIVSDDAVFVVNGQDLTKVSLADGSVSCSMSFDVDPNALNTPCFAPSSSGVEDAYVVVAFNNTVVALSALDCKQVWKYPMPSAAPVTSNFTDRGYSARGGPIYFKGQILLPALSQVVAIDAVTGKLTWKSKLSSDKLYAMRPVAACSAANGYSYVVNAYCQVSWAECVITAFDFQDGSTLWTVKTTPSTYGWGAQPMLDDQCTTAYFVDSGGLRSFDLKSGKEFQLPGSKIGKKPSSSALVDGTILSTSSHSGEMYAWNPTSQAGWVRLIAGSTTAVTGVGSGLVLACLRSSLYEYIHLVSLSNGKVVKKTSVPCSDQSEIALGPKNTIIISGDMGHGNGQGLKMFSVGSVAHPTASPFPWATTTAPPFKWNSSDAKAVTKIIGLSIGIFIALIVGVVCCCIACCAAGAYFVANSGSRRNKMAYQPLADNNGAGYVPDVYQPATVAATPSSPVGNSYQPNPNYPAAAAAVTPGTPMDERAV